MNGDAGRSNSWINLHLDAVYLSWKFNGTPTCHLASSSPHTETFSGSCSAYEPSP